MSLRYTVGLPVDKSCWLRPRWAEIFPEQKKKTLWYIFILVLVPGKDTKPLIIFWKILKIAEPWPSLSHRPCKRTRFRICLRQLWTTYHVIIAQVGLVNMCACVEPAGTAIGAVCVESGGRKWMLNHTHINCTEECFAFIFGTQRMLVRPVMKRLFFLGKPRKKGSLRSRASWQYC